MFDQFELAALPWVHLVWAALLVLGLGAWGIASRCRQLEVFGYDRERSAAWLAALRQRRWVRLGVLVLALVFVTFAAIQPRANPERRTVKTRARDIAVLLDVSRSMLADDLQPSRLERAKLELEQLAGHLKGDRLGLIAFAGDAVILCPMTASYSHFLNVLRNVSDRSVPQGGTRIGDAIRKALSDLLGVDRGEVLPEAAAKAGEDVLEDERRQKREVHADILLITDGEDHDSHPLKAAERAAQFNVGIYPVGLGSEEGTPIPLVGKDGQRELLRARDGSIVRSKLDLDTLVQMAEITGATHYPARTDNFQLVWFFDERIAPGSRREVYDEQVTWTEIFQPFLIAGLVLYLIYLFLPERPRKGQLMTLELGAR